MNVNLKTPQISAKEADLNRKIIVLKEIYNEILLEEAKDIPPSENDFNNPKLLVIQSIIDKYMDQIPVI